MPGCAGAKKTRQKETGAFCCAAFPLGRRRPGAGVPESLPPHRAIGTKLLLHMGTRIGGVMGDRSGAGTTHLGGLPLCFFFFFFVVRRSQARFGFSSVTNAAPNPAPFSYLLGLGRDQVFVSGLGAGRGGLRRGRESSCQRRAGHERRLGLAPTRTRRPTPADRGTRLIDPPPRRARALAFPHPWWTQYDIPHTLGWSRRHGQGGQPRGRV